MHFDQVGVSNWKTNSPKRDYSGAVRGCPTQPYLANFLGMYTFTMFVMKRNSLQLSFEVGEKLSYKFIMIFFINTTHQFTKL